MASSGVIKEEDWPGIEAPGSGMAQVGTSCVARQVGVFLQPHFC